MHESLASQIKFWKTFVTQTFFDVSNEICSILVKRFLGNELEDVYKKTFGGLSKSTDKKEKEKKKKNGKLQAFCVTRTRKKKQQKNIVLVFSLLNWTSKCLLGVEIFMPTTLIIARWKNASALRAEFNTAINVFFSANQIANIFFDDDKRLYESMSFINFYLGLLQFRIFYSTPYLSQENETFYIKSNLFNDLTIFSATF